MNMKTSLVLFAAMATTALRPAFADEALTVQGQLRDTKGSALTGRQTVECRLYSQAEGGKALWGVAVAALLDSHGVFTVELKDGAGSKLVDASLGDVLRATAKTELWLGIAVNGGGEMKPREEIVSVPFAILGLDSASADDFEVSATARVGGLEVSETLSADTALFQRNFTVEGGATVSGNAAIGGNVEARSDVEARSVAASGFYGAGAVPEGAIMPWWGVKSELPAGWEICDGSNGTPDLRNRFLRGCEGEGAGSTGGDAEVTLASDQVPKHSHSVGLDNPGDSSKGWPLCDKTNKQNFWLGSKVGQTSDSTSVGEGKPHNNLPQYKMLYFIRRKPTK